MTPLTNDLLERCANDTLGPVALHFRQDLVPVEGKGSPFYPPTFAMDEKYNVDTLADGTRVALVDSVGSQANRMEPLFLEDRYRSLVPQIDVTYGDEGRRSLLEAGHRLGDALVRSTELARDAQAAFLALQRGDALPMAKLAPTSLVFGAWDSRDTGVKVPRIVQAVIRAWNVSTLTRSAQFVPALDYTSLNVMQDEEKLKGEEKKLLAERGFLHVPATRDHGGIIAHGSIRRDVTVNLVALRRLGGSDADKTRRYLLGLALLAAAEPLDPFLRQGCLLVPDSEVPAEWAMVARDGTRSALSLDPAHVQRFATEVAQSFGVGGARTVKFDTSLAKADIGKKK